MPSKINSTKPERKPVVRIGDISHKEDQELKEPDNLQYSSAPANNNVGYISSEAADPGVSNINASTVENNQ
jgi:hypothetical protein